MKKVIYTRSQEEQQRLHEIDTHLRTISTLLFGLLRERSKLAAASTHQQLYSLFWMLRKALILTACFLLAALPASAATSICEQMGTKQTTIFKDTFTNIIDQPRTQLQPYDWTNCPGTAYRQQILYDGQPPQWLCVDNSLSVTMVNKQGLGTCGHFGNVLTRKCFMEEACTQLTLNAYGLCNDVYAGGDDSFDANAVDCNNMQNFVPDGGKWRGPERSTWYIFQQNRKTDLSGTVDTNTSPQVYNQCGQLTLSGSVDGRGITRIRVDNPHPSTTYLGNGIYRHCEPWLVFNGTVAYTTADLSFRNPSGLYGDYRLDRLTLAPGETTMPQTRDQTSQNPMVAPWVTITPGPQVQIPPAPALDVPTLSGEIWVMLRWHDAMGAQSYNVLKATSPTGPWSVVVDHLNALQLQVGQLTTGTKYYFTVTATNSAGVSPFSNVVAFTPLATPHAFGITSYSGASGQVTVNWSASVGTFRYHVLVAREGTEAWQLASGDLPATTLSWTVTGLTDRLPYKFKVQGINKNNAFVETVPIGVTPPCGRRKCNN